MELATEVKIVFLGESTVGKTSIISCFSQGEFTPEQTSTIGACFSMKKITLDDDQEIKLKIWDTAGQERFRALTPMYYRDAQVAILVYAVDNYDSFNKLKGWVEDLKRDTKVMPPVIITANKTDLEKMVSTEDGEEFATSVNATFMECSAKTKVGVNELFTTAANLAKNHVPVATEESKNVVKNITEGSGDKERKGKKGCCK